MTVFHSRDGLSGKDTKDDNTERGIESLGERLETFQDVQGNGKIFTKTVEIG